MAQIAKWICGSLSRICRGNRKTRALRELEMLDQSTLNDVGMSRAALVSLSHGYQAGRCAAY